MNKKPAILKNKPGVAAIAQNLSFPVVAIGASAGGLEAVTIILQNLPSKTGMAFIYVQHLNPDYKSKLAEILARSAKMKVEEFAGTQNLKPDHLYIISHSKEIKIGKERLNLLPRTKNKKANSIDRLFTALATELKERVIGILLSGSASDGTFGLQMIKEAGGLTFVQDSNSAKFNGMPQSAIEAGAADFVLPPKKIAVELFKLNKNPIVKSAYIKPLHESQIANDNPELKVILQHLHKKSGTNFEAYKISTIKRRILRRMLINRVETPKAYVKLLSQKPEESEALYQDLLINVTGFFRDPETFIYLKTVLFPKLLKSKKARETFRIWVPACSTGEEAYSLAMILLEIQNSKSVKFPIQLFATDLNDASIRKARSGLYSEREVSELSPKRIQQFFTRNEHGYQISREVRDMCIFATHNVLFDPPFSHLDFISCCNFFIYLDPSAQKKALETFHFALNDDGYLMLGKTENISPATNLFSPIHKKLKLFLRKKNSGLRRLPAFIPPSVRPAILQEKNTTASSGNNGKQKPTLAYRGLDNAMDAVLNSEFMPASVLIDHNMEILQFRGPTDLFLTFAPGKATFNILKMARPEIAFELRSAITRAIKNNQRVKKSGIEVQLKTGLRIAGIEVLPMNIEWNEPLLLVLFTEQEPPENYLQPGDTAKNNSKAKDIRIRKLEEKLAEAYADSLVLSQEHEAYTEELQQIIEEMVSNNEELQSLKEELETSKEEIESVNEELMTTNQELQMRNELLNESEERYHRMVNEVQDYAILFLNREGIIENWNIGAEKIKGYKAEEIIGKNFSIFYPPADRKNNLPQKLLRQALKNGKARHEGWRVRKDGSMFWGYIVITALHDSKNNVIGFSKVTRDLTSKKKWEEQLKAAYEELRLKNDALQKMNKELEAFAYFSSHDLQEPLRKIQTFSGRILEKEYQHLSDTGKNYFQLMRTSAERMQVLIHDLLNFSRLNTVVKPFEIVALKLFVEEVKSEFKETITEKQATIEYSGNLNVRVIPFQFRQLIFNLVSNSLKFSAPGRLPHIWVKGEILNAGKLADKRALPKTPYTHISVADNGIGFEKEYNEKIFEVFQRLHGKDTYPGTGIGLAIVKKVVENHNGFITASSELDKGTTFDIFIPANEK